MIRSLNVAIVLYVLKCIDRTLYLLSTAVSHRSSLRQRCTQLASAYTCCNAEKSRGAARARTSG